MIEVTPLSRSPRLPAISADAVEFARLYCRGALCCAVADERWRLRWCYLEGSLTGTALRLRIGGTHVLLMLEDLGAFGAATDIMRPEFPAKIRAAYVTAIGAVAWRQMESITQRAVEVLAVDLEGPTEITPECLGFEVGRDPNGPATRGFLRLTDSDTQRRSELQRVLSQTSSRQMPVPTLATGFCLRWAAVAGCTTLAAAEARSLEEHDMVLIDDAGHIAGALRCWLGVGPTRRYAGRAEVRNGGQLHMVQFGREGKVNMTSSDAEKASVATGFDDIPVTLRFELAQWNATVAEVSQLAAGAVIDIGQPIDDRSVSVWVEQRCIGKGQLVALGERLGVRLVSVSAGS